MELISETRREAVEDYAGVNATVSGKRSKLEFRKIDGPFGVEVRGIEWGGHPDAETVAELTRAMRRHLLLVLRGQESPTHDQSNAFWSAFGPLVLNTIDGKFHYGKFSSDAKQQTHRRADGNYQMATKDEGLIELGWHNDQTHKPLIKKYSVLEALEFGKGAVPTCFRDMYTVYEVLPAELRAKLTNKFGIFFDPRLPGPDDLPRLCDSMHPIISTHPDSDRKCVYGTDWTTHRIVGMTEPESAETIAWLRDFSEENAPYYEHQWEEGDICVWDNFGLQHRRDYQAPGGPVRTMRVFEGVAEGTVL